MSFNFDIDFLKNFELKFTSKMTIKIMVYNPLWVIFLLKKLLVLMIEAIDYITVVLYKKIGLLYIS